MFDIEEYSKKMKGAELFQGMGFNRLLEFKEDVVRFEVSFFNPANPGIVTTSAKIIKMGKSTAFIEGSLFDNEGNLLAKGSSSNRLIPNEKFPERNYK